MNSVQERIAQFRKMASDDPENELGHFRLGQLLLEDGQYVDAASSLRRTLDLSPQFSKVYGLLGQALAKQDKKSEAIVVLRQGFEVADERGDNIPRDEMVKLLEQLGEKPPESKRSSSTRIQGAGDGFRCSRPGCTAGAHAHQLAKPPMSGELGQMIYEKVCADCWDYWFREMSIKVINEMRLDLSDEKSADTYDNVMRETLGLS